MNDSENVINVVDLLVAFVHTGWLVHHGTDGSVQVGDRRVHEAEAQGICSFDGTTCTRTFPVP